MSDAPDAAATPHAPKENPESLVLRGRARPAVRFRRGLIVTIAGAVAAGVVALSWLALEPPSLRSALQPLDSDEPALGTPEALANAPKSYGDVPRLGPALPGDLGRPILEHQKSLESGALSRGEPGAEAEQVHAAQEAERERLAAARSSPVIVQLAHGAPAEGASAVPPIEAPAAAGPPPPDTLSATQQRKLEFAPSPSGDIDPHALRPPASPWTLSAGTLIPASLITGLNSDLPGMVLAQVTENVRDSVTGKVVLIPQGARLIGRYDSVVAYGQRRALLVWTRIVFPDGSSIEVDNVPATDAAGAAGLEDQVDSHGWTLLKGIALSTLLGVGTQLSLGGRSDLARAIRESSQQNAASVGEQLTSRNLDVQPTIRVRPGWPVRAILNKDLVLQPWRG